MDPSEGWAEHVQLQRTIWLLFRRLDDYVSHANEQFAHLAYLCLSVETNPTDSVARDMLRYSWGHFMENHNDIDPSRLSDFALDPTLSGASSLPIFCAAQAHFSHQFTTCVDKLKRRVLAIQTQERQEEQEKDEDDVLPDITI